MADSIFSDCMNPIKRLIYKSTTSFLECFADFDGLFLSGMALVFGYIFMFGIKKKEINCSLVITMMFPYFILYSLSVLEPKKEYLGLIYHFRMIRENMGLSLLIFGGIVCLIAQFVANSHFIFHLGIIAFYCNQIFHPQAPDALQMQKPFFNILCSLPVLFFFYFSETANKMISALFFSFSGTWGLYCVLKLALRKEIAYSMLDDLLTPKDIYFTEQSLLFIMFMCFSIFTQYTIYFKLHEIKCEEHKDNVKPKRNLVN
jgi:hypothetical protein